MSRRKQQSLAEIAQHSPEWLKVLGIWGWLFAGIIILLVTIGYVFGLASSLVIPLVIAVVLGALFNPLVDWLEKRKVPRSLGSALVLLLLFAAAAGTVWITVAGVISQGSQIAEQVTKGYASLSEWVHGLDLPGVTEAQMLQQGQSAAKDAAAGLAGYLSKGISGTMSFLFGTFLGAFMLFFILKDWQSLAEWVGCHLGCPQHVGRGLIDDGVHAMQQYFIGVTMTGVVVAVFVGAAALLLKLPLVAAISVVTWLTCYVPYVGAIISAAFALLVALGSGGIVKALIMIAVILIAQNVLQTIVQNQIASDRLSIHPLAALLGTILGGIFMGLVGAMLAPALVAFGMRAVKRLREHWAEEPQADTSAAA